MKTVKNNSRNFFNKNIFAQKKFDQSEIIPQSRSTVFDKTNEGLNRLKSQHFKPTYHNWKPTSTKQLAVIMHPANIFGTKSFE